MMNYVFCLSSGPKVVQRSTTITEYPPDTFANVTRFLYEQHCFIYNPYS